jgi:hypothetical protein
MGVAPRDRMTSLCVELGKWTSLGEIIRRAGAGAELDELRTAIAVAGTDPARLVVLLDAIDEARRRAGLGDGTRGGRPLLPLPLPKPSGDHWVCPHGYCDHVVLAGESDDPPRCAVAGGIPMKSFRVSP